jgi:hypothetical protein
VKEKSDPVSMTGRKVFQRNRQDPELRETRGCMFLLVLLFLILGWWPIALAFLAFWLLILVPDDWWPRSKKAKAVDAQADEIAAQKLTDRIRADKTATRRRDIREWDEEFYRLQHPGVAYPTTNAVRPASPHRGAMTSEEYKRNLARVEERAKGGRNLFPLRAIIWTWLALIVFLAPFWGR